MNGREKKFFWGGRFGDSPAEAFEVLNASIPFDVRLAPHDIRGSIAHARMLGACGIVSGEEAVELVRGLEVVLQEVEAGEFAWDLSDEDVHTAVERRLREVAGDVELKRDLVLPGYTHLQRAQPILLSHHLLSHFEALKRDVTRLEAALRAANVSPLGAAALTGTPHPIDPVLTAAELGMEPL